MRARFVTLLAGSLAGAACTVVDIRGGPESDVAEAGTSSGDPTRDGAPPGDGSSSGEVEAGGDASTCVATGTLAIDSAFGSKPIPLAQMRAAPAGAGRIAVVGRSSCADGGQPGVELRILESNGDPSTITPWCVAGGIELVESIASRSAGTWEIGTSAGAGVYTAILRTVDSAGVVQRTRTRNNFLVQVAVPIGATTVWAGYREAPAPDGTGFLGVAGGPVNETPSERVVAAAARGSDLFALVLTLAVPANPTVTLRKYVVGGSVDEDVVARSQVVTLATAASNYTFNGDGALLVEGPKVTAALPVPGAIAIYEYVEGAGWSPKASVAGLANPTTLLRSCDGSLLLAYISSAGGNRLARFVAGSPTPTSEVTLSNDATTRTLLRDGAGRVLAFQYLSGGQGAVMRVVP